MRPKQRLVAAICAAIFYAGSVLAAQMPAMAGAIPKVGDLAPAFALSSISGERVRLADVLKDGPVVLVVLRGWPGYQCPFCTRQFADFLSNADALKARRARVVFVYPGPADGLTDHATAFTSGKELPAHFTFLTDPDYAFTNAYGLRWDAPKETAYPSTFVLDARGRVTFAQTSREHGGRVPVADVITALRAQEGAPPRFKAVAFDYLVLFNPDSVIADVEAVFPGRSRELTNLWRTRQFEYTWLRSLTGQYVDFLAVTEDALVYATKAMKLELTPAAKQQLLDAFLRLKPWPDAEYSLRKLRDSGVRVIALANFSPAMLRANTERAGLADVFEALVSTDASQTYKPAARAYRLGMDRLGLEKQDILFAAFGGWDAAGAKAFGYPTVWVNRSGLPPEELGVSADHVVPNLAALVDVVLDQAQKR